MFPHNNEGYDELVSTYDRECMQEIANHGCVSGVCSQHIYYADTIAFFDKYEGEILDLIHDRYGVDELVSIFKRSEACYDSYRNECTWLFVENVAIDVIFANIESQYAEDQLVEEYMKESISNNGYTLTELNESAEDLMNLSVVTNVIKDGNNLKLEGVNPPKSITYAHS